MRFILFIFFHKFFFTEEQSSSGYSWYAGFWVPDPPPPNSPGPTHTQSAYSRSLHGHPTPPPPPHKIPPFKHRPARPPPSVTRSYQRSPGLGLALPLVPENVVCSGRTWTSCLCRPAVGTAMQPQCTLLLRCGRGSYVLSCPCRGHPLSDLHLEMVVAYGHTHKAPLPSPPPPAPPRTRSTRRDETPRAFWECIGLDEPLSFLFLWRGVWGVAWHL